MKATQWLLVLLLVMVCAGCTHTGKIAATLYVPVRCIQKVVWTRPCASVSEHLVKCDGVMVTTSCVSVNAQKSGQLRQLDSPVK